MATTKTKEPEKEAVVSEQPKKTAEPKKPKLIPYIIPLDPAMAEDRQVFEMCVNGVFKRYPRGKKIELPIETIEFIVERDELSRANAADYAVYTRNNGAFVG